MSGPPTPNPEHVSAAHLEIQAELTDMELQVARLVASTVLGTHSQSGAVTRIGTLLRKAYELGGRAEWNRTHEVRPPVTDQDGRGPFSNSGP